MNNRHKKRKKKSFDNFLGGYNMKFALFFGNRGFMPAELIAGARADMIPISTVLIFYIYIQLFIV